MRKNLLLSIFLCIAFCAKASTSITTSTVSGHWTMAGSPYLVYNSIQVAASTSLVIDPGVSVIFQGSYKLTIAGTMHAAGTAALPINFTINDTTGWSNGYTPNGGWMGITYNPYIGSAADTSVLEYCDLGWTKIDSADGIGIAAKAFAFKRSLAIKHCTFHDNKGLYSNMIHINTSGSQVIEIANCSLHDNSYNRPVILASNYSGGSIYMHDSHFYQNTGMDVLYGSAVNILIEKNEFDNNSTLQGTIQLLPGSSTTAIDSKGSIVNNKIHHNSNLTDAAIWCLAGRFDIRDNIICNNYHTSGTCGAVDGGGALNLGHNAPTPDDSTFYTVRNNVIANNYSSFHGGGISIFQAACRIVNNQIVNNGSPLCGGIYMVSNRPLECKNNLFYGNVTGSGTSASSAVIEGLLTSTLLFENNWAEHNCSLDLSHLSGDTLVGDTSTNHVGANPYMTAPTATANITDNAFIADFSLQSVSPCINRGDSAGASPYTTDYAGNPRIFGSHIDIGAFEFPGIILGTSTVSQQDNISVYPNPAVNIIFVATPSASGTISLQDITGKTIAEQTVTNSLTSFDIHSIPRGIYFAVWNSPKGNTASNKIIVE